jgi:hypothetical protein
VQPIKIEELDATGLTVPNHLLRGIYMSVRLAIFWLGLILTLITGEVASAAELPKKPATPKMSNLLRIGEMAQAAADLRKAGEAFERLGDAMGGIAEKIAESLAAMSSEFDPFGYKTAFRTIAQQNDFIQQQSEIIRELQDREIERLQSENAALKKQLDQPRQKKPRKRARMEQ